MQASQLSNTIGLKELLCSNKVNFISFHVQFSDILVKTYLCCVFEALSICKKNPHFFGFGGFFVVVGFGFFFLSWDELRLLIALHLFYYLIFEEHQSHVNTLLAMEFYHFLTKNSGGLIC